MVASVSAVARAAGFTRNPVMKAALLTGGLGTGAAAVCFAKPFATAIPYYQRQQAHHAAAPTPLEARATRQRRQYFETALTQYYIPRGRGKIDWYAFADIVDLVAKVSPSDADFRQDLWYLFGWREHDVRSPFAKFLDPSNRGLPEALKNSHYQQEQMHHYLGGVTGNMDKIPSHLLNNRLYTPYYELRELKYTGHYNWGDLRLFNFTQKHRNDFLKQGRFAMAKDLRAMLVKF